MMDIEEDDVLRTVAAGGPIDFSIWPALLPRIVSRIEEIAHHEFPIPRLPPPPTINIPSSMPPPPPNHPDSDTAENFLSPLPSSSPIEPPSSISSQDNNKENTPLVPRMNPPPTLVPAPTPLPPGALPPQITSMIAEITSTLISIFPRYPPHTLQRLSELVLVPRHHYRSLPTYLHALDRVVHVTSGLNIYPLPPAVPDIKSASLLSNGVTDALAPPSPWATPGSDEALGGALLTPIPWLQPNHHGMGGPSHSHSPLGTPDHQRSPSTGPNNAGPGGMSADFEGEVRTESTETIDGPNGVGSIETVSVSVNGIPSMGARGVGVTQGELLRQEQRAGVVPVSQLVPSHHVHGGNPLAQAHHRRASSAAQSPSSSSEPSSAASSATLDEKQRDQSPVATGTPDDEDVSSTVESADAGAGAGMNANVLGSVTGADEEKPHARGPEEIGPEDMGPQSATTGSATTPTTISTSGGGGSSSVEMQGIDVEAAVGRKAASGRASSAEAPPSKTDSGAGDADGDKMDTAEEGPDKRPATPKREAEDDLEAASSKKFKEDGDASEGDGKRGGDETDGEGEGEAEMGGDKTEVQDEIPA
ncbi:hypothetical protein AAE478_009273 [Parahypoxylon ruwenzoriense]